MEWNITFPIEISFSIDFRSPGQRSSRVSREKRPRGGPCRFKTCLKEAMTRGYCRMHYVKLRNLTKALTSKCVHSNCIRGAFIKGLCRFHYHQSLYTREHPCKIFGCEEPRYIQGLCAKHHLQSGLSYIKGRARVMRPIRATTMWGRPHLRYFEETLNLREGVPLEYREHLEEEDLEGLDVQPWGDVMTDFPD